MTFVSYAQNYEDVVLWRALRDVGRGFYVDVGAADPEEFSVTRAFYDRGWSGINIEPSRTYFDKLVAERTRDLNLRLLAGAHAGTAALHVIPGTGLSTVDDDIAAKHASKGWVATAETLPMVPLDGILAEYANQPIHFLKIDVEGAERAVLEGIDLTRFRPWIVLVEATEPDTQARTDYLWADLLLGRGYTAAQFDGLNCFYVADEHADRRPLLSLPPNMFDSFIRASELALTQQAGRSAAELQDLRADRDNWARHAAALESSRTELRTTVEAAQAKAAQLERERDEHASVAAELGEARTSQRDAARQAALLRGQLRRVEHELAGREADVADLQDALDTATRNATAAAAERIRLRDYAAMLDQRVADWQFRFDEVFTSTSWRITAPVRWAGLLARRLRRRPSNDLQAYIAGHPPLPPKPDPPKLLSPPEAAASAGSAPADGVDAIAARLRALARGEPATP